MSSARQAVRTAETLRRVAEIRLRQQQARLAQALDLVARRTHAEAMAYARVVSTKAFSPRTTEELAAHRAAVLAAAAAHADCRRWTLEARDHVERVRADVVAASASLKSRERLKERRQDVLTHEQSVIDQRVIDEAAAASHRRRR